MKQTFVDVLRNLLCMTGDMNILKQIRGA